LRSGRGEPGYRKGDQAIATVGAWRAIGFV
jgi:hypothetical protein